MTELRPGWTGSDPSAVVCLVGFGSTLAVLALTEQARELPAALVACAAGWFIVRRVPTTGQPDTGQPDPGQPDPGQPEPGQPDPG